MIKIHFDRHWDHVIRKVRAVFLSSRFTRISCYVGPLKSIVVEFHIDGHVVVDHDDVISWSICPIIYYELRLLFFSGNQ